MRVLISAVGRMKKGPESELAKRYFDRTAKTGRAIGLSGPDMLEFPESRAETALARKTDEAANLIQRLPEKALVIAFDERGKAISSKKFASILSNALRGGTSDCAFIIGGPDGLDETVRARADHVIAFGSLTLPHQLVRVLVAEQIYRAVTILTNHPYHRQ